MVRISNTDQVLLLLRQQLQRMSGRKDLRRAARASETQPTERAAVARLKALSQLDDLAPDDFERALIQGLLIDEFGEGFVNDPRFQKLVDRVFHIIASDAESRQLLNNARNELLG